MEISLSWDLLVIIFFTVIIAYTFIIGRNQSIKIIISTYIAILTADGIGNLMERYFLGEEAIVKAFEYTSAENTMVMSKIVIFILTTILITTHGKFNISMTKAESFSMRLMLSLTYGVLSAGLITSTILMYASGASLIQEGNAVMNNAMLTIYQESELVRLMINNYSAWFSLPAIAFVASSFFGDEE